MTQPTSEYVTQTETLIWRRISWPAVFSGTFVALATELLFTAFGLFIGFTLSSPGAIDTWAKIWYFVTAFVSLLIGAWLAARLSTNISGSGRIHGAVTWGLTTMATFAFAIWLFSDVVRTSIEAIRTAALATNPAAVTPAPAPHLAGMVTSDTSTLFLVIFGGILCGYVGSLIGGSLGGGGFRRVLPLAVPVRETAPSTKAASA